LFSEVVLKVLASKMLDFVVFFLFFVNRLCRNVKLEMGGFSQFIYFIIIGLQLFFLLGVYIEMGHASLHLIEGLYFV
jgi:hypothetical protein